MENRIGFRFRPTDEEMVDIYLRPKNLISNTSHVDEVINTLDICSFDPWELPSQSKINSKDQVWYFFGRKENKYNRGDRQSRKTKSGFWKKTGVTMDIMRKKGDREKIGEKRVLVFHFSKNGKGFGSKSGWVMHEYHATFSSPNDQMMRYTICKVKCKGEMKEISSASGSEIQNIHSSEGLGTGSEISAFNSQELQNPIDFISCLNEHQKAQLQDAMRAFNMPSDDWKSMFNGDVQSKIVSMQENYSHYIPQKPLSGVFDDNSSDDDDDDDDDGSDLISETTKSIQTSSTCDSFASSNHGIDQNKTPECPDSLPQEVGNQGTEIGEHRLGQEMIQKKKAGFCHRMIRKLKKVKLCSSIDLKNIISINEKKTLLYFQHL